MADEAKKPCPECSTELDGAAVLCINCGYNFSTGQAMQTDVSAEPDRPASTIPTYESPAPTPRSDGDGSVYDEWWGKIGGALLFGGIGWYCYHIFTKLETQGGSVRVHSLIAMIYKVGGKWGACGFFWILAVVFLLWGIGQLATPKHS